MVYCEDELLMLSGIQHYAYCPRQWALIHIEQQWVDNHLTLEGDYLHERADNPECRGRVRGIVTLRAVPLVSYAIGIRGISDVVEMHRSETGVELPGMEGYYTPVPIEYKRGRPKNESIDRVQVCAQALCLEEMHGMDIGRGFLYYAETRRREEVVFDDVLRREVMTICGEIHRLYEAGITPKAEYGSRCRNCSLVEVCMPRIARLSGKMDEYMRELFDV